MPINLPTAEDGRLRECRECAFCNKDCTYCEELKRSIYTYQYACPKFRTRDNEVARLRAEKEKIAAKTEKRLNFLLTAMCNSSTATQMLLEDFDSRFEDTMAERKWRQERKMAYGKIREHIEAARRLYTQYIQKDLDNLFTDRGKKKYDVEMYDNHQSDAMEWCRLQLLYTDRCWDSEESANKVVGFIESLPSGDIFDDEDIEHYRIRR